VTAGLAIDVQGLGKRFGAVEAVGSITFSVAEGEIFGLLGPNGAGKSTLIRMLTTLVTPSRGTARVAGCDIVKDPGGVRLAIGVIPQSHTSDLELSVEENLLIFAKLYGVPRRRRGALIAELLAAVDLTDRAEAQVRTLSGGMRRRVEIARGLVHQPRLLFLDEPTTGLDPVSRAAVWTMLRRLKASHDLTVLLTTHYLDEADQLCDRIAIVDHGRLVALDTPLALKASVPGKSVLDASFAGAPGDWADRLRALPAARQVSGEGPAWRIASSDGPATTKALIEAADAARVTILSLAVQGTTLDDVFLQYTGRQLEVGPPASSGPDDEPH
jgi:ABC-2 type transport system ATP-binding protein